jgi:hypothetical protein
LQFQGDTALTLAIIFGGHVEVVKLLLALTEINYNDANDAVRKW